MGKLIDAEKLEQFISDNTDHFEISSMDIDACYVPRGDLIDAINSGSLDAPAAAEGAFEVIKTMRYALGAALSFQEKMRGKEHNTVVEIRRAIAMADGFTRADGGGG